VIWRKAEGCRVTLTDGRELLDLTGGFGVAALGHRNPRILKAEVTVRLRKALPRPAKLGVCRVASGASAPPSLPRRPGPLPDDTACVIVEPVQGRAGSPVPPGGWLEPLRSRCDEAGALLVVPAGLDGSLIQATPPLTISEAEVDEALAGLA
jgi:4-aminobutyrate aminotransferase-like enzyme